MYIYRSIIALRCLINSYLYTWSTNVGESFATGKSGRHVKYLTKTLDTRNKYAKCKAAYPMKSIRKTI